MATGQFLSQCSAEILAQAALRLRADSLVAFPTETVYGLGADAESATAVARIYSTKGRPTNHPLIIHIEEINDMQKWAREIPEYAIALARKFWPGPMTLVLRRSTLAQDFVTGGQDTVGVRVPSHPIARALLREFKKVGGGAIAAPSANRFGHVSPTTAADVAEELTDYLIDHDMILDGGASQVGLESTIIDCTAAAPRVLRPGAITEAMISDVTGMSLARKGAEIRVSGSLENHYAPVAKVILDVTPNAGDGFIALKSVQTPDGVIRLASPTTHAEFAHTLYAALRKADHQNLSRVVVVQPEGDDIAVAIRDRLQRASHGR